MDLTNTIAICREIAQKRFPQEQEESAIAAMLEAMAEIERREWRYGPGGPNVCPEYVALIGESRNIRAMVK